MRIINELLKFIYPECCEVCGRLLLTTEAIICSGRFLDLPRTNYHTIVENPVAQLFWGRVQISAASSYFYFLKGSAYQPLLHRLKYKGKFKIGEVLGRYYAGELQGTDFMRNDIIIPVPLHSKKLTQRGYNQSECIAMGVSVVSEIPVQTDILIREKQTDTQTRRGRFDRYLNMAGNFRVTDPSSVKDRNILLIDDVVTTGSTVEACAEELLKSGCASVSLLTLAVA